MGESDPLLRPCGAKKSISDGVRVPQARPPPTKSCGRGRGASSIRAPGPSRNPSAGGIRSAGRISMSRRPMRSARSSRGRSSAGRSSTGPRALLATQPGAWCGHTCGGPTLTCTGPGRAAGFRDSARCVSLLPIGVKGGRLVEEPEVPVAVAVGGPRGRSRLGRV